MCVTISTLYYNNAPGIFSLIKRKVKIKWCFEMAGFEIESGCWARFLSGLWLLDSIVGCLLRIESFLCGLLHRIWECSVCVCAVFSILYIRGRFLKV